MKTNLNEQVSKEYYEYLRTKAMVDAYKPKLKQIAKDNNDLKLWTITFGQEQRIMFMFYSHQEEQANLNEFIRIKEMLENEFGVTMKADLSNFLGKGFEFIEATATLPSVAYRHGSFQPKLIIRMFNIDKCEIEYVEKTIKEPHLTGFCAEVIK